MRFRHVSILIRRRSRTEAAVLRIVRHALELKKDVLLLNIGPTRADALGIEKIEYKSGDILGDAARIVL